MDTGVGHKVGLELGNIDIQSSIETKRGSQRTDNLGNEPVKVGVGRTLNIKVATADIVKGFVVETESTIGVLQKGVGGKDGVVGFDNSGRNLGRRRNGKGKLGLASVVNREPFEEERSKTRSGSSTSGMEDEESLKTGTVVGKLPDTVKDLVDVFLSNGVVTTGVVVGSIFLSIQDLVGVVKLTVGTSTNFVTDGGLKIDVHGTRNMTSVAGLAEKGVEGIVCEDIFTSFGFLQGSIGFDSMLQAVKLPAVVTSLDTGLTQVNRDTFAHGER
mmetsp:Transcript_10730/g.15039  ORF Transcript_10730/g.15039 Transcript_10730/m.15039 type:complete len:272 (+) Transcript_10730:780-1595(+)